MKKVKIPTQENQIDWDKPQWLIHKEAGNVVLSTGKHCSNDFSGTCLPSESHPNGEYCKNWSKACFKPLTYSINFEISNNED